MLRFVAVHDNAHLRFKFPALAIDIQHDSIHAEIHCGFLAAESGTEAAVEEQQNYRLVLAEMLPRERCLFYLAGFLQRLLQVADIAYIKELFHIRWFKELISRQL